jgi:putative FmdB family regulatory protein
MPVYDYACTSCGRSVEVLHGVHVTGPEVCDVCGGRMRKLVSAPAVVFKGSGWAKKDARDGARQRSKAAAGGDEGGDGVAAAAAGGDKGSGSGDASSSGAKDTGAADGASKPSGRSSGQGGSETGSSASKRSAAAGHGPKSSASD